MATDDSGAGQEVEPLPPFRRRLDCRRSGPGEVVAELEDHLHHVAVRIQHDGEVVTAVEGRGVRLPWSLCPGAVAQLDDLVGRPLGATPAVEDPSLHCTHLLECGASAVRFAGTGAESHRYDVGVVDDDGDQLGTVSRDDGFTMVLRAHRGAVVAPDELAGRSLGAGFSAWVSEHLDADRVEAALLLRRAIWMRLSVAIDLDHHDVLATTGVPEGSCYASQPQRIQIAARNRGSSLPAPLPVEGQAR